MHLAHPDPDLRTDRVRLRRWSLEDLPCVEAAATDPDIPTGTTVPEVFTEPEGRAFIERQWSRNTDGRALALAVAAPPDGVAVGQVYLALTGGPRECRLGYWLIPSARRKGIATEAIRLASRWVLEDTEVYRLVAEVHPDNVASRTLLEGLGFTEEGVLRSWLWIRGEVHDAIQYSLVRSDLA